MSGRRALWQDLTQPDNPVPLEHFSADGTPIEYVEDFMHGTPAQNLASIERLEQTVFRVSGRRIHIKRRHLAPVLQSLSS